VVVVGTVLHAEDPSSERGGRGGVGAGEVGAGCLVVVVG
jgi:hypothetical protein